MRGCQNLLRYKLLENNMRTLVLLLGLSLHSMCIAVESTVTVPWNSFDDLYRGQIEQEFMQDEVEPEPLVSLEQIRYDLRIRGALAVGTVSIAGNVLVGYPQPLRLFGQKIAVTEIIETQNAVILAADGAYRLYTHEPGMFLVMFSVSIPITDFQVKPRLAFDVPVAVRNELVIEEAEHLKLVDTDALHEIDGRYFFSPTRALDIGFEHVRLEPDGAEGNEQRLVQVDTPDAVLDSVTFFVSFTEDGTVLSAMNLELPPNEENQLLLEPIAGAELWSLHVNGKPRSLYQTPGSKWVVPLDPKVNSRVVLAYLTRSDKLELEGRLDFSIPETGLAAREVNLMVGLPQRMQMLAMDSDLQPASGNGWPRFRSFNGRPHFFSRPFYRGHAFTSSIIYQEPVKLEGARHDG